MKKKCDTTNGGIRMLAAVKGVCMNVLLDTCVFLWMAIETWC
ncbi:MAG: hypothetical protein NTV22_01355 [bacterium]|nr:hypothetical protein [bacterium]